MSNSPWALTPERALLRLPMRSLTGVGVRLSLKIGLRVLMAAVRSLNEEEYQVSLFDTAFNLLQTLQQGLSHYGPWKLT